jgi:hypothetical protein
MPGNSAGLVRAHRRIVMSASQDTYTMGSMYASGNVPTASFIYPNDRYLPADVAGFTKFTFTLGTFGTVTAPTVTVYFTNDPITASGLLSQPATGIWTVASAPADQVGGGVVTNPIVPGNYMQFFAPMFAYRLVTNAYVGGGQCLIDMIALP